MNKYVKSFFLRGLTFGGFGPIIVAVIYALNERFQSSFVVNGYEVCTAIMSVYLLAFIQAGASVFNQIEHWPLAKSLFFHFTTIYAAYIICYLINTWIPFKAEVVIIFTVSFIVLYFVIWFTVYLSVKAISRKLNRIL